MIIERSKFCLCLYFFFKLCLAYADNLSNENNGSQILSPVILSEFFLVSLLVINRIIAQSVTLSAVMWQILPTVFEDRLEDEVSFYFSLMIWKVWFHLLRLVRTTRIEGSDWKTV